MAITLNNNAINSVIQNMLISQQVFADPISGLKTDIVDANRVDGTLFGDQKLYYSVDMIHGRAWTNDSEAANLLALERNKKVACESITLDKLRIFKLTTDAVLTKNAFMNEGNFANFNSVQLSMIREGKRAYDTTEYNTFIGTHGTKTETISYTTADNEALVVGNGIANIFDDMAELSREYNDNQYLRAFAPGDCDVIINNKFMNSWRKVDLPTVFHKDGILGDYKTMNHRYFGRAVTASDKGSGKVINTSDVYDNTKGTLRAAHECKVTVSNVVTELFAGEELPNGTTVVASGATAGTSLNYADVYLEQSDIIGIIVGKGAIPYMSAAENSTSFWNPQSLTTSNFLIYGHNTLKALKEKPYIIIKQSVSAPEATVYTVQPTADAVFKTKEQE